MYSCGTTEYLLRPVLSVTRPWWRSEVKDTVVKGTAAGLDDAPPV